MNWGIDKLDPSDDLWHNFKYAWPIFVALVIWVFTATLSSAPARLHASSSASTLEKINISTSQSRWIHNLLRTVSHLK